MLLENLEKNLEAFLWIKDFLAEGEVLLENFLAEGEAILGDFLVEGRVLLEDFLDEGEVLLEDFFLPRKPSYGRRSAVRKRP